MIHKLLDWLQLPRVSAAGDTMGVFGRLTFNWLWTDDPELGKTDAELSGHIQVVQSKNERKPAK